MFLNIDKQKKEAVAMEDCEGQCLTYGELAEIMKETGKYISSGCIVFCLCRNTVGAVSGYLGLTQNEAVPLLLSSSIDRQLLNNLLKIYKPSYIWMPEETELEYGKQKTIYRKLGYRLVKTGNPPYPLHPQLELLMTTSGSTGSPKLVRYRKGNLESNARNVAKAFGWSREERGICDLGMQYTMGLNVINSHLYAGAMVLLTTYNLMSSEFWDYIRDKKATNFTGVPFSYEILSRLHFTEMDLPHLTTLAQGGGKLTDRRFTEYAEYAAKNNKRFVATFGTTETAARLSMLLPEYALTKTGSIGKALPEGDMFLIDESGRVLPEGEAEGELCYRGPNVTMGYASSREDLLKGDEWQGEYHTGDLAKRDKEGFYYITGRRSRFLKLLSYRVSLDQCETMIRQEMGIECACTGTDEKMKVYLTDESSKKDVIDLLTQKTGLFRSLFQILTVPEIPRNESGKIKYRELEKMR